MKENNINLRTRKAVAALGDVWEKLGPEERNAIPEPLLLASIELMASIVKAENPQPSPNHALILRAIYWLPEREAGEIVGALDELEKLKNNGR